MQAESRSLYVLKSFADKPVFINFVFFLRKERRVDNIEIQKFISKKADLLFALSWKSDAPTTAEVSEDNDGVFSLKIVAFWFNSTLMKQNTELLLVILLLIFFRLLCSHATVRAIHGYTYYGPERAVFSRY